MQDRIWDLLRLSAPKWRGAQFDRRWKEITILELLQHRGGWDRDKSFDPIGRMDDITAVLGIKLPSAAAASSFTICSAFPLDRAGRAATPTRISGWRSPLKLAIQQVTRRDYEEYRVRREVLLPLGIRQMRLGHALPEQRAAGEVRYYDSERRTGPAVFGPQIGRIVPLPDGAENFEAYIAHGGWIASAPDLVRFAAAFDDPTRCPVLSAKSVETMFSRPPGLAGHGADGKPTDTYYGCGWSVRPVGNIGKFNFWHIGMISGTSTLLVCCSDGLHWVSAIQHRRPIRPASNRLQRSIHCCMASPTKSGIGPTVKYRSQNRSRLQSNPIMCGRYTLRASPRQMALTFRLDAVHDLKPRYTSSLDATSLNRAIRHRTSARSELIDLRWGLDPYLGQPIRRSALPA